MTFSIVYASVVVNEDIPRLSASVKQRIKQSIKTKLTTYPEQFGKPLRRSLKGYRKLRVGDYRVAFRIDGAVIKVFVIQHRSVVYQLSNRRLT